MVTPARSMGRLIVESHFLFVHADNESNVILHERGESRASHRNVNQTAVKLKVQVDGIISLVDAASQKTH